MTWMSCQNWWEKPICEFLMLDLLPSQFPTCEAQFPTCEAQFPTCERLKMRENCENPEFTVSRLWEHSFKTVMVQRQCVSVVFWIQIQIFGDNTSPLWGWDYVGVFTLGWDHVGVIHWSFGVAFLSMPLCLVIRQAWQRPQMPKQGGQKEFKQVLDSAWYLEVSWSPLSKTHSCIIRRHLQPHTGVHENNYFVVCIVIFLSFASVVFFVLSFVPVIFLSFLCHFFVVFLFWSCPLSLSFFCHFLDIFLSFYYQFLQFLMIFFNCSIFF